jgi:hypothetical protein
MALFARITAGDATKISVHRFGASLRQMAAGQLTRQQVIDAFALTGSDVTELDALMATYTAMPTNNTANAFAKASWLARMEDVFILVEMGDYTEAKAKTALGF